MSQSHGVPVPWCPSPIVYQFRCIHVLLFPTSVGLGHNRTWTQKVNLRPYLNQIHCVPAPFCTSPVVPQYHCVPFLRGWDTIRVGHKWPTYVPTCTSSIVSQSRCIPFPWDKGTGGEGGTQRADLRLYLYQFHCVLLPFCTSPVASCSHSETKAQMADLCLYVYQSHCVPLSSCMCPVVAWFYCVSVGSLISEVGLTRTVK